MARAIVVGSINMDIVAYVENHPKIGETVFGKEVKYFPGGKGSNQAVSCKRLGCETLMVGRVGKDAFGEEMVEFQRAEGIDVKGVAVLENASTGIAFITVSDSSDNSIIVNSGANSEWSAPYLESIDVQQGDLLLAQFEIPDQVIINSFQKAKKNGAITILNPAPVRHCSQELIDSTDVLVVNEIELQEIAECEVNPTNDESIFKAADILVLKGFRSIVITLGEKGVRVLENGNKKRINGRVVAPVDTTGAGDCFIGGLAFGLLSGLTLHEATDLGNNAASISVTREGAASSIPTMDEVNGIFGVSNES